MQVRALPGEVARPTTTAAIVDFGLLLSPVAAVADVPGGWEAGWPGVPPGGAGAGPASPDSRERRALAGKVTHPVRVHTAFNGHCQCQLHGRVVLYWQAAVSTASQRHINCSR